MTIDENKCNNCGRCVGKCPFDCIEESSYGYRIYIGGRWGKSVAHGIMIDHFFESEEEVMEFIEKAILLYREQR